MREDAPESTKNALLKSISTSAKRPTRKNKKPERDLQKKIFSWCREAGMHVYITDRGYWGRIGMLYSCPFAQGHSDISGNDKDGLSVYIEVKAPGRIKTLKSDQREFLKERIKEKCFATVTDDLEKLKSLYFKFKTTQSYSLLRDAIDCV